MLPQERGNLRCRHFRAGGAEEARVSLPRLERKDMAMIAGCGECHLGESLIFQYGSQLNFGDLNLFPNITPQAARRRGNAAPSPRGQSSLTLA